MPGPKSSELPPPPPGEDELPSVNGNEPPYGAWRHRVGPRPRSATPAGSVTSPEITITSASRSDATQIPLPDPVIDIHQTRKNMLETAAQQYHTTPGEAEKMLSISSAAKRRVVSHLVGEEGKSFEEASRMADELLKLNKLG